MQKVEILGLVLIEQVNEAVDDRLLGLRGGTDEFHVKSSGR